MLSERDNGDALQNKNNFYLDSDQFYLLEDFTDRCADAIETFHPQVFTYQHLVTKTMVLKIYQYEIAEHINVTICFLLGLIRPKRVKSR